MAGAATPRWLGASQVVGGRGALNERRTKNAAGRPRPAAVWLAGELAELVSMGDPGSGEAARTVEVGAGG